MGRSISKTDCPDLTWEDPAAFESLLSDSEAGFLHSYKTLHPPSSGKPCLAAYSLQQDPSSGFKMLTITQHMHTLIKNVGLIWMPCAPPFNSGRWITPTEALLVQGTSCFCCFFNMRCVAGSFFMIFVPFFHCLCGCV